MRKALVTVGILAVASITFASDLPDGWYPIGDADKQSYNLEVTADAGVNGAGLTITKLEDSSGTFGGVGQTVSATDFAGKVVRMSAYIRTESVEDGYAGLWFRVDEGKDMLVLDNMRDRGVEGTTDWQSYETVVRVDTGATRIVFGALLTGSGRMFVDEFELKIVPDDTPTTVTFGPTEPQNLGF